MNTPVLLPTSDPEPVPADLREWIHVSSLIGLILEIVPTVAMAPVKTAAAGEREFAPRSLLALLTYCYATGVYASKEIERRATTDRFIRRFCGGGEPSAALIRRFRRSHRPELEQALGELFERLLEKGGETGPDGVPVRCGRAGVDVDLLVVERVRRAILIDTALDD